MKCGSSLRIFLAVSSLWRGSILDFKLSLGIQPLKMEQIDGSETPAFKNQTPGIHPKDYSQYSKHGEIKKVPEVSEKCTAFTGRVFGLGQSLQNVQKRTTVSLTIKAQKT
jgi:hypothetical protein